MPIAGPLTLFFTGAALALCATSCIGFFMASIARNMPELGMVAVLVLLAL